MPKNPKSKEDKFLKIPEYPGGKQALQEFINMNLRYPEDALQQRIEGVVSVAYDVDDNGMVISSKIIKGLSPSCNEEALRVVNLLQYGKAFNHGIRVKSTKKVNIYFRLSNRNPDKTLQISYSLTETSKEPQNEPQKKDEPIHYSYTIYR